MKDIDLNALPFDAKGQSVKLNKSEAKQIEQKPFWTFSGRAGKLETKPILVHYQNAHTIFEFGRIEIPRQPCLAAYNQKRPLVIYVVLDNGVVLSTRLETDEITNAVVAKRVMPHFPSCPAHIRAKQPEGFTMLVLKLPKEEWVEIEHLQPVEHRKAIELHKKR